GVVQPLVLDQLVQLRTRLAPQACFFLLLPLGLDALVLFPLRADRIGLGQVDVFLRARLARGRLPATRGLSPLPRLAAVAGLAALLVAGLLAMLALRAVVAARFRLAFRLGGGLEAQPERVVAACVAHGAVSAVGLGDDWWRQPLRT